jgi:asparagine synthase (glutamine-hydrolysing)
MKHLLKTTFAADLPQQILHRRDKMGFPVPLAEWFQGELREFLCDTFRSSRARSRPFINTEAVLSAIDDVGRYSRKIWGLLSLELWHQLFHDRHAEYRARLRMPQAV